MYIALEYHACINTYSSVFLVLQVYIYYEFSFLLLKQHHEIPFPFVTEFLYLDRLIYPTHISSVRCNTSSKRDLCLSW